MPRFFCEKQNISDSTAIICGNDAHHMTKVLRMRQGENVTLCDMNGTDFDCIIESINENNEVTLKIINQFKNQTEPSINITLYQAMTKSDKLEFIIQKAVELGVTKIVPMQTKFCVAKNDKKDFQKKLIRYNKIALEAAKQSGRGIIPTVADIISYSDAITTTGKRILYYENGGIYTDKIITSYEQEVSIYIGSEGGFSEHEVQFAIENGVNIASLGKLILRCETAPIVSIALILNATGNM